MATKVPRASWNDVDVKKILRKDFTSFSGVDIKAIVHIQPIRFTTGSGASEQSRAITTKELATLQTISISVFRDKQQVRSLGTVADKGVTRGPRTIAGSMIFTVFNQAVLAEMLSIPGNDFDMNLPIDGKTFRYMMIDQLPPFDITLTFANEYGTFSLMHLIGIDLHSEGQVMSIEDLMTESTVQYTARNMVFMHDVTDPENAIKAPGGWKFANETGAPSQVSFDSILRKDRGDISQLLSRHYSRNPFH